jgi:hypothetical protein
MLTRLRPESMPPGMAPGTGFVMNQRQRSKLLPALSALALLDLTMLLLVRVAGAGLALLLGFAIILAYVTYLVLATRDIVTNAHRLHPIDRSLCRWSGPLALLIAVTLLLVAIIAAQKGAAEVWFRSRSGLLPIKYAVEVGLILSVACRLASDELGHVLPRTFWRTVSTPLLIVFGAYVILIPVGQFDAGCRPEAP